MTVTPGELTTQDRIRRDPARIEHLLHDVYCALRDLNRCGLTLDPDCPAGVSQTYEDVGDFLYPEQLVGHAEVLDVVATDLRPELSP